MREAAEALRLTAQDLKELGVCDRIIPEPLGGAHRDQEATINSVRDAIAAALTDLKDEAPDVILSNRRKKFLSMGNKGLAA